MHFKKENIVLADFSEAPFSGLLDDISILGQLRDIALFQRYPRCNLEMLLGTLLCQESQICSSNYCTGY